MAFEHATMIHKNCKNTPYSILKDLLNEYTFNLDVKPRDSSLTKWHQLLTKTEEENVDNI